MHPTERTAGSNPAIGPEGTYQGEAQWIAARLHSAGNMGDAAIARVLNCRREVVWRVRTGRQSGLRLLPRLRHVLAAARLTNYAASDEGDALAGRAGLPTPAEYLRGRPVTAAALPRLDVAPKPAPRRYAPRGDTVPPFPPDVIAPPRGASPARRPPSTRRRRADGNSGASPAYVRKRAAEIDAMWRARQGRQEPQPPQSAPAPLVAAATNSTRATPRADRRAGPVIPLRTLPYARLLDALRAAGCTAFPEHPFSICTDCGTPGSGSGDGEYTRFGLPGAVPRVVCGACVRGLVARLLLLDA